jgi:hypothetical protein
MRCRSCVEQCSGAVASLGSYEMEQVCLDCADESDKKCDLDDGQSVFEPVDHPA